MLITFPLDLEMALLFVIWTDVNQHVSKRTQSYSVYLVYLVRDLWCIGYVSLRSMLIEPLIDHAVCHWESLLVLVLNVSHIFRCVCWKCILCGWDAGGLPLLKSMIGSCYCFQSFMKMKMKTSNLRNNFFRGRLENRIHLDVIEKSDDLFIIDCSFLPCSNITPEISRKNQADIRNINQDINLKPAINTNMPLFISNAHIYANLMRWVERSPSVQVVIIFICHLKYNSAMQTLWMLGLILPVLWSECFTERALRSQQNWCHLH